MVNQSPREHSREADERPEASVVRLLDAAAAPAEPGPQPGEEQALAAFRASRRTRRIPMFSHTAPAKAAVAATIATGTLLFAGVGAAAAGVLPDEAQDTASSALAALGFDVPRANEHAGDHPAQRGAADTDEATEDDAAEHDADETADETADDTDDTASEETTIETDDADVEESGAPADPEANDHGKAVSDLAKSTTLTGADKGAAVSELASSKAKAAEADDADGAGKPAQPGAQADSHKKDGAGTADEKSGGRSGARSQQTRP
jgi:hypothetical protein